MSPERHQRVKEIFGAACEREPGERPSYLDAACAGDPDLRTQVCGLLEVEEHRPEFLAAPLLPGGAFKRAAAETFAAAEGPGIAVAEPVPVSIGRYRVVRLIGQGGMGSVYEAVQDQPHRRVALKVIRPGLLSRRMLQRFEHEVELLGRLQHPGIARIYDAGVASVQGPAGPGLAQPYFAMELVEGQPLTRFCRDSAVGAAAKLELLAKVCEAAHHGHQRGVIHRDLKPMNILVDGAGQPKIIDFGVARAADAAGPTAHTAAGQFIGTLAYMSPEHIAGGAAAVDIRSDVYSLGVIGFEALAGRPPYDLEDKTVVEAGRIVQELDAPRLGALDRTLRGDAETVIAKALDKDPARRYQSALDLAQDLRRILRHEPIAARLPTAMYQVRKFARRNRALAAGTGVALAGLLLGLGGATWQALRATQQRDRAVQAEVLAQQEAARAVAQSRTADRIARCLTGVFSSLAPPQWAHVDAAGGPPSTLWVLSQSAETIAAELKDQPLAQAQLLETLGRVYLDLGLDDRATAAFQAVLDIRRAHEGRPTPADAPALQSLGAVAYRKRDYHQAVRMYGSALALLEERPADAGQIVQGTLALASAVLSTGDAVRAEGLCRRALALQAAGPADQSMHADALCYLASALEAQGRLDETEATLRRVLGLRRGAFGPDSPWAAITLIQLAGLHAARGDAAGREALVQEAVETWERTPDKSSLNAAGLAIGIGRCLLSLSQYARAEPFLRTGLLLCRKHLSDQNAAVLDATHDVAKCLFDQGRFRDAEPAYREALALYQRAAGEEHPEVGTCLYKLAQIAIGLGDEPAFEPLYGRALAQQQFAMSLAVDHPHRSGSLLLLGLLETTRGELPKAEAHLRECVAIRERTLPEGHRLTAYSRTVLGTCLMARGRLAEAGELLAASVPVVVAAYGPRSATAAEAIGRMIRLLELQGMDDEAVIWRAKLPETGP